MDVRAVGDSLAREAARFAGMGWMRGTSGNLSVVIGTDPLRLVVTGSGKDKGELTSADVVVVDAEGRGVEPDGAKPSAEAAFHAAHRRSSRAPGRSRARAPSRRR